MLADGRRDLTRFYKVVNCVKCCTKNWTECSLAQHRFPIRFVSFFVSSACLLVRVTAVSESSGNGLYTSMNTVVASLLFILEGWVPRDDAIVVAASKLRKLWDSLSELRSSLCERRLERTALRPALLPFKTAQFTQFFPSGIMSHSKIAQFNWECI